MESPIAQIIFDRYHPYQSDGTKIPAKRCKVIRRVAFALASERVDCVPSSNLIYQ